MGDKGIPSHTVLSFPTCNSVARDCGVTHTRHWTWCFSSLPCPTWGYFLVFKPSLFGSCFSRISSEHLLAKTVPNPPTLCVQSCGGAYNLGCTPRYRGCDSKIYAIFMCKALLVRELPVTHFCWDLFLTKTVPNPPSVYRAVGSIQFS